MGLIPTVVSVAAPAGRALIPPLIRLSGQRITARASATSCLVLAPHPDDETLGCGAVIARKRESGASVQVVVAADGRYGNPSRKIPPRELAEIRRKEVIDACAVLGVPSSQVIQLGYEDGALERVEDELTNQVTWLLERHQPTEVYVTSPSDPHPDHAALGRAVLRAVGHMPRSAVLTYPVWQWPRLVPWLVSPRLRLDEDDRRLQPAWRTRPVLISVERYRGVKLQAMAKHRSQVQKLTDETEWPVLTSSFMRNFFGKHEVFFPVGERRGISRLERWVGEQLSQRDI